MTGWIIAAFLVGWILGVSMSYRKIRKARRIRANIGKRLFDILKDADIVKVTITDDGEKRVDFDQKAFDELLGNRPTKH